MYEQMSIFDLVEDKPKPYSYDCWPFEDIEQMTLADVAEKVGNALGITFTKTPPASSKYAEFGETYEAKAKGYKLEISIDRYDTMDDRDGSAFIGAGYSGKHGAGGGAPCDTVNEAIMYFEKLLKGARTNETTRNYRGNDRTAEHRGQ